MARLLAALLVGLLAAQASAKRDKPSIKETPFDSLPTGLHYFEDSDVILARDSRNATYYRSEDAGQHWARVDGPPEGEAPYLLPHPYDGKTAVLLGDEKHWISKDQGKTWTSFKTPDPVQLDRLPIAFHANDPDRMIVLTSSCRAFDCQDRAYYTTDGFSSEPKLLRDNVVSCLWAKATPRFTTGDDELDRTQILCVIKGSSFFTNDKEVRISSDFFKTDGIQPSMPDGSPITGIISLAAVKSYMVIAAGARRTTELAMFVTDDTKSWHQAQFGEHRLEEGAYTLLESTNYSMQVDVMTARPTQPMGVLLTSNSNGTFFRKNIEHTNRSPEGYVDFEKIQDIQGIVMVNTVDNWEEIERHNVEKKVKTSISFDDGRTWQPPKADDKFLQLHSVTGQKNSGRVFSSQAPGLVMGVGNTGNFLDSWDKGDTYVSDNAGVTWRRALEKPHFYEFGDKGGILVAIEDKETDTLKYSLNHGKDWEKVDLKDLGIDGKIQPIQLTTTPDSTSLKFVLVASKDRGSNGQYFIYSIDFTDLHERECKKDDFEDWFARVDEDGKPTCIMGHTQKFRRRKADEKCFVNEEFKDPVPIMEDCKCTDQDYECDYEAGFAWSGEEKKCVSKSPEPIPKGSCEKQDDKYMGSSGYKLIPGNTCTKEGGSELDKPVERKCGETRGPLASGKIETKVTSFKGEHIEEYYYLERAQNIQGDDETVVMRTDRRELYISRDHGKTWDQKLDEDEIVAIYPHQYLNDIVYFVTPSKKVYYSHNRGKDIHHFDAPEAPNKEHLQILQFHPTKDDWIIWTGSKDGQTIAHVSTKRGEDWDTLLKSVRKCQFVASEIREGSDETIFCEQHVDESADSPLTLVSSSDFFKNKQELKSDVVSFATMAEYIVVAVRDEDEGKSLRVDTSVDGKDFAAAQFPPNFKVPHQQAFTVLDSSTHAIFLHVTVNNHEEQEYGSIVKSNSNGTSYVLSVGEVNRNRAGYVDFEKMQGLEGVAVINRVANLDDVNEGSSKKLKTYITHNDGAEWALLPRPEKDPKEGEPFPCSSTSEQCSLHLHGYTERRDPRDTYSSASAVGIMMATGNVGEYLVEKNDKNTHTFLTSDGGVSWTAIAPGNWQWEYGDQGSILVIVKETEPTNFILYSLDEGRTWMKYEFSDDDMIVDDITTVPSDMSRMFLLWGKIKGKIATVHLDFRGLTERSEECKLDDQHPTDDDYDLWSPRHPLSDDDCLFGHVAQYHRKKVDAQCYNGRRGNINHVHEIARNCSCTRADFECDYNFERKPDGTCQLVTGLAPADPQEVCRKDPDRIEYSEITGYRKVPISTCEGGKELDYTSTTHPCPNHNEEYEQKHGISGAGLFFAITLPIAAAVGVGYWVWKNWDGKFGRIRLGGDYGGASFGGRSGGVFDGDAPWVKYPVIALSGLVAVIAALPMIAGSLWNAVSSRLGGHRSSGYTTPFTSRSSFQRGRGDYAAVHEDEGELLGEDSDEDV